MSAFRPARLFALLALAASLFAGGFPEASGATRRAVLPAWTVGGDFDLQLDIGMVNLEGMYTFTLADQPGSMTLRYDEKAQLVGGGSYASSFFSVTCTTWADEFGEQRVRIVDDPEAPFVEFDGRVQANSIDIEVPQARYGAISQDILILSRVQRTPPQDGFRLLFSAQMDRKGRIKGTKDEEGREERANLFVFPDRQLEGGLVRGKVKTRASDGTTTAKIKIRAKGWIVTLLGPVDADGFHALADVRGGGFVVDDLPVLLPVLPGPEPPPPPPPPPPKNLVKDGVARIVNGQVTITRQNLPSRYWTKFGRGADLTVEFPQAEFQTAMTADATSSGGTTPRRCFVTNGTKTWGTAGAAGSVALSVSRRPDGSYVFSTSPGQTIEVLCQGTVADASGRVKQLDVLVQATVVQ